MTTQTIHNLGCCSQDSIELYGKHHTEVFVCHGCGRRGLSTDLLVVYTREQAEQFGLAAQFQESQRNSQHHGKILSVEYLRKINL